MLTIFFPEQVGHDFKFVKSKIESVPTGLDIIQFQHTPQMERSQKFGPIIIKSKKKYKVKKINCEDNKKWK